MGANAQTSVPTFTAGQVLTAAQMNESARTGVPVFADTSARDAAFGGTGEKTLAEGQLCYVENLTGVAQIQYYDGASWVSLTATSLVKVAGETTFSAVSAVTLPNSTFTSTYKFYRMNIDFTATNAAATLTFQVRSSGTTSTASYYAGTNRYQSNNLNNNLASSNAASATVATVSATGGNSFVFEFANGFGRTAYASWSAWGNNENSAGSTFHGGTHFVSQNNDAAVLTISAGTITGSYTIYGYAL